MAPGPTDRGDRVGPVERAVRDDLDQLGDLSGIEPSLSSIAVRLARAIDESGPGDGRMLPQFSRELRQTLAQLAEGRRADDDDDDLGDLGSPD